jgi:hypothetical protein
MPIVSSYARHGTDSANSISTTSAAVWRRRILVDGQNLLDASAVVAAGSTYRAMGRPNPLGASGS